VGSRAVGSRAVGSRAVGSRAVGSRAVGSRAVGSRTADTAPQRAPSGEARWMGAGRGGGVRQGEQGMEL